MLLKRLFPTAVGCLLLVGVATAPAAVAAQREPLHAVAANITGHALTLSGQPSVTVTRVSDNRPVSSLFIEFKSGALGYVGCSAYTNTEGVATCNSGVSFSPLFIADAVLSGYNAVFSGNTRYLPFVAHGTVTPAP